MALIYDATLTPSKIDILTSWLPSQPWLDGADVSSVEPIGAYRFDDPDDEVGIETHLLRTADGSLLQVPMTYRGAPLDGAEHALIATMQHSVLGERWAYDGCADPVYVAALVAAIVAGGCEAALEFEVDGRRERRDPSVRVTGSGNPAAGVPVVETVSHETDGATTVVRAGDLELVVRRGLAGSFDAADAQTLTGTWNGSDDPTVLALVR